MHPLRRFAIFVIAAHCWMGILSADTALTIQNQALNPFSGAAWTLGFEFSPNVDIEVVSLGFYDRDADGLSASHEVAIWDSSGNLIASSFVSSTDPVTGFFRFRSIAPVTLLAGNVYVAGSHDFRVDEAIRDDQAGVLSTIDPNISILAGRWNFSTASLTFPSNRISNPAVFYDTVSFEFMPVTVAESIPRWFSVVGLLGFVVMRRSTRFGC